MVTTVVPLSIGISPLNQYLADITIMKGGWKTNKQENKILSEIIDPKQNPQLFNGGFYFELTTVTDMEWFCTI